LAEKMRPKVLDVGEVLRHIEVHAVQGVEVLPAS
jgi:hypothetical protein